MKRSFLVLGSLFIFLFVCEGNCIPANSDKVHDDLVIPEGLITKKNLERDPTLYIAPEEVWRKIWEKKDILLIDVRSSDKFEAFRIAGSINMPLFSIKNKAILQSKYLVIFNEGFEYRNLEKECKYLRTRGFNISILNGGLNFWRQTCGPLEGDIFSQKGLNKIAAATFFEENVYSNLVVVDTSDLGEQNIKSLILQSISLPFLNEKSFLSKTDTLLGKYKNDLFATILIGNKSGQHYDNIEKAIQKSGLLNVFFLKDGFDDYRKFLKRQVLIWQKQEKRKVSVKKCTGCP